MKRPWIAHHGVIYLGLHWAAWGRLEPPGAAGTGACRLKPTHWLVAAGLLGLTACTEYGYVKPGVSDAEFVADSEDCAEIARRQAVRDYAHYRSRARFARTHGYNRRYSTFTAFDFGASLSEFEFRYRQLCMFSKGYELAPLDEEPASDGPEAGQEEGQEDGQQGG